MFIARALCHRGPSEEPRETSLRTDPLRADGKAAALFCGFLLVASFPRETLNAPQFWLP